MEIIVLIVVVVIFFLLNKDYNSKDFKHIKVNIKQTLNVKLEEHEAGLLIALMAKVAKADGKICELEAELLSNIFTDISLVFENNEVIREELKRIYSKEKETFENTIVISKKYLKLTKNDYQKRLKVLEYLLNLAFIDGEFSNAEIMIVEDIANAIEIKKVDLSNLIQRFQAYYTQKANDTKINLEKAYIILELSKDVDNGTIKKQYRTLVKKYHPDIVTGLGANQETINEATNKLQTINEAYEIIKKERGL